MKVADNVAYGLRLSSVPKSQIANRVSRALDMVRMTAFAGRKPAQLSGGQQQRIARDEMQVELKLLQRELGTTFVFVTHDQEEALSMSDRVAVIKDGKIGQIGTASSVYDAPESAFVAGFIGRQNSFLGTTRRSTARGSESRPPACRCIPHVRTRNLGQGGRILGRND